MTSHDLAVPDESRGWQAFGEGISHHFVRAQRYEFEKDSQYAVRVDAHSTYECQYDGRTFSALDFRNTGEGVFVQKSGFSLRKSKIG